MQAVIYIFRCPKGRVYAGWRGVSPEALRAWPNRGTGPLPCGYTGSGNPWRHIARRHRDALTWRIVARVDGTQADVDAAERRAIHLTRLIFGRRCVNVLAGGQGITSEEARVLQTRPEVKANHRATNARPEVAARRSAANKAMWSDPEARAKRSAANKEAANRPQGKAHLAHASQIRIRKGRARKALAPFRRPPTITHPGVTFWAYRPGRPLGIGGPLHNKE